MDSQSKVIKVEPRADARELIYSSSNVSNSHVTYQQQTSMKREVTRSHLTIENVCPSSSSISSYQDTSRRDDKGKYFFCFFSRLFMIHQLTK